MLHDGLHLVRVYRVLQTQDARFVQTPTHAERHQRMRHRLPDHSGHLRAEQSAEAAAYDGLAVAIETVGESQTRPKVRPSVVVVRMVGIERRAEIEFAPILR